jgi:hypothetical protein
MVCNDLTENKCRQSKDRHQMFELWPNFLTSCSTRLVYAAYTQKNVQYARCLRCPLCADSGGFIHVKLS